MLFMVKVSRTLTVGSGRISIAAFNLSNATTRSCCKNERSSGRISSSSSLSRFYAVVMLPRQSPEHCSGAATRRRCGAISGSQQIRQHF
jgi:hypothetical protein